MKNSKLRKTLMLLACAVMLVCLSVGATLAYLTATTNAVKNTFTVGKVIIDLDEGRVNEYGEPGYWQDVVDEETGEVTGTEFIPYDERVMANEYKLLPGHTYQKDPIVYVDGTSEPCWLFVRVVNEIADIEATGDTTIHNQILANGWVQVDAGEGYTVYGYQEIVHPNGQQVVFESFKIDGDVENEELNAYVGKTIKVQAYAVQADGLETQADGTRYTASVVWEEVPLEAWATDFVPDVEEDTTTDETPSEDEDEEQPTT